MKILRLLVFCVLPVISALAQTQSFTLEQVSGPATAPGLVQESGTVNSLNNPVVRVCRRPLPRWAGSRNLLLASLNRIAVRYLHHSYISFENGVFIPSAGGLVRTVGIHPVGASNRNKQPMLDQSTDNLDAGGECKVVKDSTPEKIQRLIEQIAADTCYSCGNNYHNRALTGCYNNSNTYVYDLIKEAGMTPPKMKGAPGYRGHHTCHV